LQNTDFSGIVHYVPLYRSAVQRRHRISVPTRASLVDPCQLAIGKRLVFDSGMPHTATAWTEGHR
jgi:hypothetical protein